VIAAQGSPSGIQCGCPATADGRHYSHSKSFFSFTFFDQRCAGWENRWKWEEQTSDKGAIPFGNKAGKYSDSPAKKEPDCALLPFRSIESRKIKSDFHRILSQNQEPSAQSAYQPNSQSGNSRLSRVNVGPFQEAHTARS
jgi:hypothetical protein